LKFSDSRTDGAWHRPFFILNQPVQARAVFVPTSEVTQTWDVGTFFNSIYFPHINEMLGRTPSLHRDGKCVSFWISEPAKAAARRRWLTANPDVKRRLKFG
jgi:hypothetical protein